MAKKTMVILVDYDDGDLQEGHLLEPNMTREIAYFLNDQFPDCYVGTRLMTEQEVKK